MIINPNPEKLSVRFQRALAEIGLILADAHKASSDLACHQPEDLAGEPLCRKASNIYGEWADELGFWLDEAPSLKKLGNGEEAEREADGYVPEQSLSGRWTAALLAALFLSSAAQAQEQPRICGSYKTVAGVLQSERFAEKPIQRRSRDGRTWEFWASLEGRTWTILELLPNRACLVQSGENAPLRLGEEVP